MKLGEVRRDPSRPYPFEKLDVWRLAVGLTQQVYGLCRKLPREELYGLNDQLRRSAVSIGLNIAEGRAADTDAEFRRYLGIALKSLVEITAGLKLAVALEMLPVRDVESACQKCDALEAKLRTFRRTLEPK